MHLSCGALLDGVRERRSVEPIHALERGGVDDLTTVDPAHEAGGRIKLWDQTSGWLKRDDPASGKWRAVEEPPLELDGAEEAERGMAPAGIADAVDVAG
ncbi:hypothetical protein [Methylobacterium sp. WSM2598]|uniref:hypothetical protein n=1 Tax=Methylobacterium sp. WSM2598 TaxID=398261 RepID=UPI000369916A|nr:hypothetical protein [Methylobacterium sp. WSM2598]